MAEKARRCPCSRRRTYRGRPQLAHELPVYAARFQRHRAQRMVGKLLERMRTLPELGDVSSDTQCFPFDPWPSPSLAQSISAVGMRSR